MLNPMYISHASFCVEREENYDLMLNGQNTWKKVCFHFYTLSNLIIFLTFQRFCFLAVDNHFILSVALLSWNQFFYFPQVHNINDASNI